MWRHANKILGDVLNFKHHVCTVLQANQQGFVRGTTPPWGGADTDLWNDTETLKYLKWICFGGPSPRPLYPHLLCVSQAVRNMITGASIEAALIYLEAQEIVVSPTHLYCRKREVLLPPEVFISAVRHEFCKTIQEKLCNCGCNVAFGVFGSRGIFDARVTNVKTLNVLLTKQNTDRTDPKFGLEGVRWLWCTGRVGAKMADKQGTKR